VTEALKNDEAKIEKKGNLCKRKSQVAEIDSQDPWACVVGFEFRKQCIDICSIV